MDDAESRSELVEDIDGVELTKYLEEEGFRFPSIVYEITSDRDEPVTVRVEDPIPDGVAVEDVGFHPAYGDDYWSVDDGTLVFEYELEPRAQYKTVYEVRGTAKDEIEDVLESPEAVEIEAESVGGDESSAPEALTRSAADSPYDSTAGGIDIDGELESTAEEPSDQLSEPGPDGATEPESLVDRLAAEVEEGRAADESLEILEAALGPDAYSRGSVDARFQQIQSDISDLRAYTTALESFLDENGGAQAVIEEFESRQDSFDADLDDVESSVSELTDELGAVRTEIAELDEGIETVTTDLETVSERVDGLETDLERLDDRMPAFAIGERVADIETELESISDFVDSLQNAFE